MEEEAALLASQSTIVIPTALSDTTPSNRECLPVVKPTLRYTSSQPLISTRGVDDDTFSGSLEKIRIDGSRNRNIDLDCDFFKTNRSRSPQKEAVSESMFELPGVSHGPSAVNLKTGLSVFSLDFPPVLQVTKPIPPIQPNRSPKVKRKTATRVTRIREKKKSKPKEDDWCSFDPLQSLSVMSYGKESAADDDLPDDDDEAGHNADAADARFMAIHYDNPEIYADIAARTKSVGRFTKLAYPDMYGNAPPPYKEPLYEKRFGMQR